MKRENQKSFCPINQTVEIFGDTWSLLIIRDMAALGKRTFGEFLESEERIGPSVLADRLAQLEKLGIVEKRMSATDRRKYEYTLTEKGVDVIPIVYEMAVWGSRHCPDPKAPDAWFQSMHYDKSLVIRLWQEAVRAGDSFFLGERSVVNRLGLQ